MKEYENPIQINKIENENKRLEKINLSISIQEYEKIFLKEKIFIIKKLKKTQTWNKDEDKLLIELGDIHKGKKWKKVAEYLPNKNSIQCCSRYKRIKPEIIKGSWTKEEDEKLLNLIKVHGFQWGVISKEMINRTGKQIRDRYLNSLNTELNRDNFTKKEDRLICILHFKFGNAWAKIAKYFKGRTGDMIKNRFYSNLRRAIKKDFKKLSNNKNYSNFAIPENNEEKKKKYKYKNRLLDIRLFSKNNENEKDKYLSFPNQVKNQFVSEKTPEYLTNQKKEYFETPIKIFKRCKNSEFSDNLILVKKESLSVSKNGDSNFYNEFNNDIFNENKYSKSSFVKNVNINDFNKNPDKFESSNVNNNSLFPYSGINLFLNSNNFYSKELYSYFLFSKFIEDVFNSSRIEAYKRLENIFEKNY